MVGCGWQCSVSKQRFNLANGAGWVGCEIFTRATYCGSQVRIKRFRRACCARRIPKALPVRVPVKQSNNGSGKHAGRKKCSQNSAMIGYLLFALVCTDLNDMTTIQPGVRTTVANSLWGNDAFPGTRLLMPNKALTIG